MTKQFLDKTGLTRYNEAINAKLNNKVDKEAGKGLFSGSFEDLTHKPNIPTKTSDLTNDSKFVDENYVNNAITTAIESTLGGSY